MHYSNSPPAILSIPLWYAFAFLQLHNRNNMDSENFFIYKSADFQEQQSSWNQVLYDVELSNV